MVRKYLSLCYKDGSRFMNILLMVLRRKSAAENEELVLSTLSTLNNLSYYAEPESTRDGPFAQHQLEIAQGKTYNRYSTRKVFCKTEAL